MGAPPGSRANWDAERPFFSLFRTRQVSNKELTRNRGGVGTLRKCNKSQRLCPGMLCTARSLGPQLTTSKIIGPYQRPPDVHGAPARAGLMVSRRKIALPMHYNIVIIG